MKKHFVSVIWLFIAVGTFCSGCTNSQTETSASVEESSLGNVVQEDLEESITLKVRALLTEKKFDQLNQYLLRLQTSADVDIEKEELLYAAYYSFRINDQSFKEYFDEWIDRTPDSFAPYYARAEYNYGLAWSARGTRWASETKEESIIKMKEYFALAMVDIESGLKRDNHSMVLYSLWHNIENALGNSEEAEAVARKALEINPLSYVMRSAYINGLKPRWGGNYEKMAVVIKRSQRYVEKNPMLNCLKGEIYADVASMSVIRGAPTAAEEQYTQALSFGECHRFLFARGKVRYKLERYQDALEDFNRAIELYPEDAEYYYWRGSSYVKLGNNSDALSDAEFAEMLDPYDSSIKRLYEWLLVSDGFGMRNSSNKSQEIDRYNEALRINPDNADTYVRRARAYLQQNQNDLAIKDLDMAITLDPNNIEHYVLMDFVLAKSNSWKEIISYWDKYIENNPESGRAYRERGGAYYRMGDLSAAVNDAKKSAELGDLAGRDIYERFKGRVK